MDVPLALNDIGIRLGLKGDIQESPQRSTERLALTDFLRYQEARNNMLNYVMDGYGHSIIFINSKRTK